MSDVSISRSGPPETILPGEPQEALDRLSASRSVADAQQRRALVSGIVADFPTFLEGWAELGDLASDVMDAYASYRVGYHRGLDRLRQNGWRGSGFVRWEHPGNRGFLRALAGLQRQAAAIGEVDEDQRCALFLRQLDPAWPPPDLAPPANRR
jgi:hypothetical protein